VTKARLKAQARPRRKWPAIAAAVLVGGIAVTLMYAVASTALRLRIGQSTDRPHAEATESAPGTPAPVGTDPRFDISLRTAETITLRRAEDGARLLTVAGLDEMTGVLRKGTSSVTASGWRIAITSYPRPSCS
jgi:hypothetical protein